jgi:hypothetical protein
VNGSASALPTTPTPTLSEPLYSEDFEDDPAQDWSLGAGWQVSTVDGNTVLLGRDHYWANLTREADWTDYAFKFRLNMRVGAVHLNYRVGENPFSRYFLKFNEGGFTLNKQVGDDFIFMGDNWKSYPLNTWHTVEIKGFAGHLQVLVDGVLELDLTDEEPLLQGTIAFESLTGSEVLIDDIEIWHHTESLTAPQPRPTGLAGSITDLSRRWIDDVDDHRFRDRDEAPLVSRIIVSPPNANGIVTVTGKPGAITAVARRKGEFVRVTPIDWNAEVCVPSSSDGSFSAEVAAGPATTIILGATHSWNGRCGEPNGQRITTPASAIVRVPEGVDYTSPSIPFSVSGNGGSWRWFAQGELGGGTPYVVFTLPDGPPEEMCLEPRLHVRRLFDADGQYSSQVNLNVHGPVLTPTGLPIESRDLGGYWSAIKFTVVGDPPNGLCLDDGIRYEMGNWRSTLQPGWYLPQLVVYEIHPDREYPGAFGTHGYNGGIEENSGIGFLPMVGIGDAAPPRIPVTLLNDTPSWGSGGMRGIVAREDDGRFALGSRRAAQGPFVASLREPLSGRRVKYLLEPYLPTLGYSGFTFSGPQITFLPLDQSALGSLSVILTKPNGDTVTLAEDAPIIQTFVAGSSVTSYPVEFSFAGPGGTYALTTGLDALEVDFDQYGLHTVSLTGSLQTLHGQRLTMRGTYDIWVAEPLDLSLGTFEGTPLEVGEEWSPVVVVEPGVPAEVEVRIEHYVDGNASKKRSFRTYGKANQFGYFVADGTWKPEAHGEYIAQVIATYTDPIDGTMWMGTRTGASIVATPNTSLIAHGERTSSLASSLGLDTLHTWFVARAINPEEPSSADKYPFFRGDVTWLEDSDPIGPSVTLEDPENILDILAPQVANNYSYVRGPHLLEFPDMKKLRIRTTAGEGGHHRPDAVDSWAYWYTSTIRPDISVHHTVNSGGASNHNHWYGTDTYNCQIGLACYGVWDSDELGGREGDEEGDIKLFFGGAVVKSAQAQHFVPYASMAVVINEGERAPIGNRLCPPYQGAAGGLATCGPILTIRDREVDLFVTPTGTRPGSVLEVGDTFVFSGQAWPTLDVAVEVTVTTPLGQVHSFSGRASSVGYIDAEGKKFTITEPGVYTVHVKLVQDRPLPSTGLAPDPPIIADGRTTMKEYDYAAPLSAILGSSDSTYHFFVAEPRDDVTVSTQVTFEGAKVPSSIVVRFAPLENAGSLRYTVTIPGMLIKDEEIDGSPGEVRVVLDQDELYSQGYTNVVLGAESMEITLLGTIDDRWFAKQLNLRGVSPLGGESATIR